MNSGRILDDGSTIKILYVYSSASRDRYGDATMTSMIAAGQRLQGDIAWILLLLTALLGSPAVIATLTYWMPDDWHPVLQGWVTALLAVAVVAAELYLAMCLLAWGANVAGPGLIE